MMRLPNRHTARTRAQLGVVVILFSGCFSYVPAEPGTLPEGGRVRVQLTRQGFAALPEIPRQSGPRLAGTLVSQSDEQLRLRVPVEIEGTDRIIPRDVVIPARDVVLYENRRLSRTRTAIAVAGGIATAIALYVGFEKGNPFTNESPEQPEEEDPGIRGGLRVPFLRVPVR
jgi:hypothetical protein